MVWCIGDMYEHKVLPFLYECEQSVGWSIFSPFDLKFQPSVVACIHQTAVGTMLLPCW